MHMLKLLALLVVCTVSFFMQGKLALAHEGSFAPVHSISQRQMALSPEFPAPLPPNDCSSQRTCCMVVCSPCQVLIAGHRAEFTWRLGKSSAIPALGDDCLRSIILGRDPPVPRSHRL